MTKVQLVTALVEEGIQSKLEIRQKPSCVAVAIISELGEVVANLEPRMAREVAATLVEYATELERGRRAQN